jgi:hypothetical protein
MKPRPIRLRLPFLALASLIAFVAGRAEAAGISIVNVSSTGASTSSLAVGDVLTVDLVVDNDTNLDIYGIGLGAYGYDANGNRLADDGLRMIGVTAAASVFNTTVVGPGQVFGGLNNVVSPGGREITQLGSSLHTQFLQAISLSPASGDGSLDIGIGGRAIADGDVHFRILFQAISLPNAAELTLTFGTRPEPAFGDVVVGTRGVLLPFDNATLSVSILADPNGGGGVQAIPEPGAALLFAAGLLTVGLARPR